MQLQLSVMAAYQKAGSLLRVSVSGSYGPFMITRQASMAFLSITLIRLAKFTSSGPVYVTTVIESNIPVGIERNGTLTRDGEPAGPLLFSKKISSANMKNALVKVDLQKNNKLITSETVHLK
ncbi:MAG: hypothetical protein JNM88_12310 [Chitinophagaceae bacterium]|nr:hypothetical protein [Chitinophagaceae bacterium]